VADSREARGLLHTKKEAKTEKPAGDFFLSFDSSPAPTKAQEAARREPTIKEKPVKIKFDDLQPPPQQEETAELPPQVVTEKVSKKDKKAKEEKVEKKKEEFVPKDRVPYEQLPNKVKKRMEKRKEKREMLKAQKKIKIDLSKSEDSLVEKYKQAYGDTVAEEKLKEYVYYQKLIFDAKNK
jgi:biopolymer transport protein ExbD